MNPKSPSRSACQASDKRLPSSFRDPSGFVFRHEGVLYRNLTHAYKDHYELLLGSGLYAALVRDGLLVEHEEIDEPSLISGDSYRVLRPELIPFISYPYEWCFSQLKAAALLTLRIQELAIERGMSLKDASAFNVQFHDGRPVFIDTSSLERFQEGRPWVAYGQFCRHFLTPLLLMSYLDVEMSRLSRVYLDGIPLALASAMLPWRSRLRPSVYAHIFLHARYEGTYAEDPTSGKQQKVSKLGLRGILDNLRGLIASLDYEPPKGGWVSYYETNTYTERASGEKEALVSRVLDDLQPRTVWDLGANTARFSRISSRRGILTVAMDSDAAAVERTYRQAQQEEDRSLLPLVMDLANPSPALGWQHSERMGLIERGPAGLVLALALVHHLAIHNNVPLDRVAHLFSQIGESLVVEFVPKSDPQVEKMLATREDIFDSYDQQGFENSFRRFFKIEERYELADSERSLYRMRQLE